SALDVCAPADAQFTVDVQPSPSTSPVTLAVSGAPANTTTGFSVNPVTPPGSSVLTVSGTGSAATGSYNLSITATGSPGDVDTRIVQLNLSDAVPGFPTLEFPPDNATGVSVSPTLFWTAASQGGTYAVAVATDAGFTD